MEIAKLQKSIFLLKEEAEKYEKENAPTEAELWVRYDILLLVISVFSTIAEADVDHVG